MFYDYHVHTNFSGDSSMDMEECIQSAIKNRVTELCFTDHLDIDYPGDDIFGLDYEGYKNSIDSLRKKYKDKITIKIGLEMGLQSHITDEMNDYIYGKDLDFIIGSIHAANKKELYGGDFYQNKSKSQAYNEYFEYLYTCIKGFNDFDVLGHIDIIKRYANYEDISLLYKDHKEIIDTILSHLISTGRGIEINTSGIRYSLGSAHPTTEILKAYKRLGGEIITTGSDSHHVSHLATDFHNTYELLRECGFKYVTTYDKRKPKQISI